MNKLNVKNISNHSNTINQVKIQNQAIQMQNLQTKSDDKQIDITNSSPNNTSLTPKLRKPSNVVVSNQFTEKDIIDLVNLVDISSLINQLLVNFKLFQNLLSQSGIELINQISVDSEKLSATASVMNAQVANDAQARLVKLIEDAAEKEALFKGLSEIFDSLEIIVGAAMAFLLPGVGSVMGAYMMADGACKLGGELAGNDNLAKNGFWYDSKVSEIANDIIMVAGLLVGGAEIMAENAAAKSMQVAVEEAKQAITALEESLEKNIGEDVEEEVNNEINNEIKALLKSLLQGIGEDSSGEVDKMITDVSKKISKQIIKNYFNLMFKFVDLSLNLAAMIGSAVDNNNSENSWESYMQGGVAGATANLMNKLLEKIADNNTLVQEIVGPILTVSCMVGYMVVNHQLSKNNIINSQFRGNFEGIKLNPDGEFSGESQNNLIKKIEKEFEKLDKKFITKLGKSVLVKYTNSLNIIPMATNLTTGPSKMNVANKQKTASEVVANQEMFSKTNNSLIEFNKNNNDDFQKIQKKAQEILSEVNQSFDNAQAMLIELAKSFSSPFKV